MTALDTNVFIYACDKSEPERQKKALDPIDRVTDGGVGTLYSEDIPSREEFGPLRVVNPFA
jgi:predicted nucleic acid-binding protein